ncbi:MAG TPA: LexA family transcriptional regulator [Pelagibacterium sp.]|uniref:LexA family transcriptional regulator n=1 Tax=Pelagibacterium sp. TaxID=1967288 RepID=UPI002CC4EE4A|nr:LexA family transcriptional regulator [Pelagibacterium sp.]HWJ89050.1 LexA family transcriptional regulator [Pelagibacterium sp.]
MEREIIAKWLETGIKVADITQSDLAEAIGISQDQVSKIIKRKRSMTAVEMIRAAIFLSRELPARELAGEIRPLHLEYEATEPLALPAAITPEMRFNIPDNGIPQIDGSIGLGSRDDVETLTIDLGNGENTAAVAVLGTWHIPSSVLQRRVRTSVKNLHMVECEGNSMHPLIKDGDMVMIDQSRRNPNMPGVFALYEDGGQTIKQVEVVRGTDPLKLRLIPANKDYSTYEVNADEVHIIGRYVARFTVD